MLVGRYLCEPQDTVQHLLLDVEVSDVEVLCTLGGPVDVRDVKRSLVVGKEEEIVALVTYDVSLVVLGGRLVVDTEGGRPCDSWNAQFAGQ